MNKETLEELVDRLPNKKAKELGIFLQGAKWEQQRSYSDEQMMEYAKFCIHCYNQGLPNITPNDWKNLYENEQRNSI